MGLAGLVILRRPIAHSHMLSAFWIEMIIYGALFVLIFLTIFYLRISLIIKWIDRLPGIRKYAWLLNGLEEFNATLLLQILSLSAVRFFVFVIQYFLLFRLYDVEVSWWQGLWAVSVVFLIMAVIPTIALFTDLGLRGKIGLTMLNLFSTNDLGITWALATIWFINLIIPALAGSLLILSIKRIYKTQNDEKT
jgi:hypothetical protein